MVALEIDCLTATVGSSMLLECKVYLERILIMCCLVVGFLKDFMIEWDKKVYLTSICLIFYFFLFLRIYFYYFKLCVYVGICD